MTKNENITEIQIKEKYIKESIIVDSDKENKNENIYDNNTDDIKNSLNKRKNDKNFLYNDINNNNSMINSKDIINNNFACNVINNDDEHLKDNKDNQITLNNENNLKNDEMRNSYNNINNNKELQINDNKNLIKNNNSLNNIIKFEDKSKKIKFKTINNESHTKFKNIFTHTTKNITHSTDSNKEIKYYGLGSKIIKTDTKLFCEKENSITPKNNINISHKKGIISFNSVFIKKSSNKKGIKSFSLENDCNIKKVQKKNCVNKKDINDNILFKYTKDYKEINNNKDKEINALELIKVKKNDNDIMIKKEKENETKEEIIKNNRRNYSKDDDKNNKNIEVGYIKEIENEVIPYNQKIFNKIIEEVKGEKNYIQKIVHRHIKNKRDFMRNSFSYNKYDPNTFKEITTKKIRNPLNIFYNKESGNKDFTNNTNGNIKTELHDDNTNDSCLSINNNISNNLKNEININKKENIKKSSIKIKKIPLNKLRHKIKIPNLNCNLIEKTSNTQRVYPSPKNFMSNYSLSHDKNTNSLLFSHNGHNPKNLSINMNDIHKNDLMTSKNNNMINNEPIQLNKGNENITKILYNKVKLKKRVSGNINKNNFIKINKMNNICNSNKGSKIIKMSSGKISYERNNNALSAKFLNNSNNEKNIINNSTDLNDYQNKLIQEKKIGLFKKKLTGISLEKHFINDNASLYLNNLYNKNINTTIFKSYISNKNKSLNDSFKMNSYIKLNNLNTPSTSILSYESKNYDNLNLKKQYNSFLNLNNQIPNNLNFNDFIIGNDNQNNEIKLEQIITLLSFEDLLIIEDKLNIVLNVIKNGKKSSEELFDLWNYFFSSSLKPKFEQIYKYFLKETEAMKIFINYSLILIIICYDISFNTNKSNNNIYFSLYETLRLVYINLLIVIYSIKNKIQSDNKDHYNLRLIEMSNINKIIGRNLINFNSNSYDEDDISFNRELLHNNTNLLIKNISLIIKSYKHPNILNLFYTIKSNSLEEINIFFRKNILHEDFLGCSVLASTYLKEKQNFPPGKIPYILTKNNKKYSLVIDLDETLIHFKVNHEQNDEGVLKLRPGVLTFLEKVHEFYEIILFTEASEAYTELIMEAFNKKQYFDYKLFRQHTIIIGQDFVKDLQRIGRPLDKIIIIDNIAQNFRMQKANGINIKPFFGEDQNDQALIDLIPILINIAKDNIDTRNGLIKYRDEIITKITSNLFRRSFE